MARNNDSTTSSPRSTPPRAGTPKRANSRGERYSRGAQRRSAGSGRPRGPRELPHIAPANAAEAVLLRPIEASLRRGHPWVFKDAIKLHPRTKNGDVVLVRGTKGQRVGVGFAEPASGLTLRMWGIGDDLDAPARELPERIATAAAWRRETLPTGLSAYRLCHGENDAIPGLHADVYGDVLSLRTDGRIGLRWRDAYIAALKELQPWRAIVHRNPLASHPGAELLEGELSAEIEVREGERRYLVDVIKGQKTGFFCDQRPNRDTIQSMSAGAEVLNLFSYTGGFSVAAALGGASKVTSVDIAAPAIELARRNMELNGADPSYHSFAAEDVFKFLERSTERQDRWDIVIVDPPSFAHERSHVDRALRSYERLNTAALSVVEVGGLFASASCSSRISEEAFLDMLGKAAAAANRRLAVIQVAGAGADHPLLPSFPEGRYLKFVLARVLPG